MAVKRAIKPRTFGVRGFFLYPDEKTIGVGTFLRFVWIVNALAGVVMMAAKAELLWVWIYLITGAIWVPAINTLLARSYGYQFSTGLRLAVTLGTFLLALSAIGPIPSV